jgi:ribosome-associated toxin RatA of RatAB toxin-antitoxin module
MPSARHSIEIDASSENLLAVITDFEAYPDFLPDIVDAKVVSAEDGSWEVRFALHLIRRLDYTLRLVQENPHRIRWTLIEGLFRKNSGGWEIEVLEEGSRVRAHYDIEIQVGMFLPGTLVNTLVQKSLPDMLACFKTRAEARQVSAHSPAGSGAGGG